MLKNNQLKTISYITLLFTALIPYTAYAVTNTCVFAPTQVRVGQTGGKEGNLIVCDGSDCYNLGLGNDDQSRNRYSTAITALTT